MAGLSRRRRRIRRRCWLLRVPLSGLCSDSDCGKVNDLPEFHPNLRRTRACTAPVRARSRLTRRGKTRAGFVCLSRDKILFRAKKSQTCVQVGGGRDQKSGLHRVREWQRCCCGWAGQRTPMCLAGYVECPNVDPRERLRKGWSSNSIADSGHLRFIFDRFAMGVAVMFC